MLEVTVAKKLKLWYSFINIPARPLNNAQIGGFFIL